MVLSITLKVLFAVIVNFVILRSFARNGKLVMMIVQVVLLLAICMISEFAGANVLNRQHMHGSHTSAFWINLVVYLLILSISFAIFFTREWIAHEKQRRELVEYKLTSELNFLKSQINPHFLFNTLNNLYALAQYQNNTDLAGGIHKLSGLMRYVLYDSSAEKVSLTKELEYIRDFIGLNKLRYDESEVTITIETEGITDSCYIAPMILIPFIENAFKHGVKVEAHADINIIIRCSPDQLYFRCDNPIFKHEAPDQKGGIGLDNVKRRLELLYPGKHKLDISHNGKFAVDLVLTLK